MAKTSPKRRAYTRACERRLQCPTDIIVQECGARKTLVFVEVERVIVDDDTGEILEEGWSRVPMGSVDENVEDVLGILHSAGVAVYMENAGDYSFAVDGLQSLRSLIPGAWFGWYRLKALGLNVSA